MSTMEHRHEAERLLEQAKAAMAESQPYADVYERRIANLVAAAQVHALLAKAAS